MSNRPIKTEKKATTTDTVMWFVLREIGIATIAVVAVTTSITVIFSGSGKVLSNSAFVFALIITGASAVSTGIAFARGGAKQQDFGTAEPNFDFKKEVQNAYLDSLDHSAFNPDNAKKALSEKSEKSVVTGSTRLNAKTN